MKDPCPYCGALDHGAITAPTVTCARHLWDIIGALRVERGVLRWALQAIKDLPKPGAMSIRRIIAAANESVTLDAITEAKGDK
jgi:hypothetical protein